MPTKVWPLHPLCKLGTIQFASFLVRGRNSNMLVALATQHIKRRSLVRTRNLLQSLAFALYGLYSMH